MTEELADRLCQAGLVGATRNSESVRSECSVGVTGRKGPPGQRRQRDVLRGVPDRQLEGRLLLLLGTDLCDQGAQAASLVNSVRHEVGLSFSFDGPDDVRTRALERHAYRLRSQPEPSASFEPERPNAGAVVVINSDSVLLCERVAKRRKSIR